MIEYQKEIHDYGINLLKLELVNFRLFEHITLEFQPTLNVLIGINGSGKTSVLDAIAKNLFYFIQTITTENQDIDVYSENDIRTVQFELTNDLQIELLHNEKTLDSVVSRNDIQEDEYEKIIEDDNEQDALVSNEISIRSIKNRKKLEPFEFDNFFYLQNIRSQINKNIRLNHEISLPTILYFKTDYSEIEKNAKIVTTKLHIFNTYDNCLDSTFDLNLFFEWYKWQGNLQKNKKKNFTSTIENAVYKMLTDEENTFSDLHIDYENSMQGELMINKNGIVLKIDQLSSGEKRIFVIAANLAFRLTIANPEKDDPLQGQGIVIIDEIDLHLHPQWQRRIIPQLRKTFPNIQFIVTTHSPLVLESLDLDNIIVLDNGKIIDPIVSPKGREVGEILEEIMGESAVAIQDNINHYFALISENKFDEAEIYKNEVLLKLTDRENPIFYQADAIITRKRILAK